MRIELDKLEGKSNAFAHTYEPGEIVLDEENARLTEAPQINGRITRSGQEVRLQGTVTARAEVDCDRCLKAVSFPVETEFDVTYVPASEYYSDATAELQEEDLSLSVFDGEAIDVDDLVREQVLLAMPPRLLCGEQCKGLCPVCGVDKNATECACQSSEIDPRWAALALLKQEQKDGK
ncbi:MAG TPA: DUF177 domain-containing protein [Pyrinomonadaceae bacterium]|jgi:uncharacterized protein|nr:DUF177 domain-containing protein [Pyrinomonadaceae bacterium]